MVRTLMLVAVVTLAVGAALSSALDVRAAKPSPPPAIREVFTPLPCSGKPNSRSTLQQLGCAEQAVLRTDKQIDALADSVFARLRDNPAKRRFVAAEKAWLAYRRADCLSVSDVFEGGSQGPVVVAQCSADRNRVRIRDLRTFLREL
jgi:uncharacterized protein YecT (DUF1311 family)